MGSTQDSSTNASTRARYKVELPWDLTVDQLEVEPGAYTMVHDDGFVAPEDPKGTADGAMSWISDELPWESEELELIMRGAVLLYQRLKDQGHNPYFGYCLWTAIIWSRG